MNPTPSASFSHFSSFSRPRSSQGPLRQSTACFSGRRCIVYDQSLDLVPYVQAWDLQKRWVDEAASSQLSSGDSTDRIIILQHPPVYTLGTGSTLENLKFSPDDPPHPLHRTERGGEVTYHGPGQLVVYPILNLRHHRQDLHWYLRSLEEVVIRSLDAVSGLRGERVDGLTGVWCGGAKVCAMGVRAAKWVTYHGLALNVVNDLTPFRNIVPCGIEDKPVTSVRRLVGLGDSSHSAASLANAAGPVAWSREDRALLQEYSAALLESMTEVFGLEIEVQPGPAVPVVAMSDSSELESDDYFDPSVSVPPSLLN